MIISLLIFFYFGSIFGSFSTVLIERWYHGKGGILSGRSECPHCHTILGIKDLFPLFSYIWNKGKCSHCNRSISLLYPIAEVAMGTIFMLLAYSAIQLNLDIMGYQTLLLMVFGFVTGVYILYDYRYGEIPDQIMVPAILLLLSIPFISLLFIGYNEYTFHTFHISLNDRFFGAYILYTFFYIQILIPGGYFLLKNGKWKQFGELLLSYITFPIVFIIDFFRTKKEEKTLEIPTWVGGGDLRIAIFIGLTLGTLHGISSFGFAYLSGSIVGIFILVYNAIKGQKTNSQIPFGPFLGFGWIMSIIFYSQINLFIKIFIN